MKRTILFSILSCFVFLSTASAQKKVPEQTDWKAGVARVVITPKQPMAMAGFASRNHPSEGTLHDLWAKALALEDAKGKKAILITTDLLGFPKDVSNHIRDRIKTKFGLERDQIILNSSHTHSGPVLQDALTDIYVLDAEALEKIKQYSLALEDQIVKLAGDALGKMEPAALYSQNGVTRFEVNRRNNPVNTLTKVTELKGPSDHAVPVIKVVNKKGELKAIAFGYACHNTVLEGYQWSGDYAGFAQIEVEKYHPGTTAMFFQGAGADQNPLPRGTAPLAKQYGRELAAAVDRVIEEDMRKLPATLSTAYSEIDLPLGAIPDKEELSKIAKTTPVAYQKRWAERMISKLDKGEQLIRSYPYPVQVWSIGGQALVALGGELTVEYAIITKQMFGQDAFVLGYSNDVMTYIPSCSILQEGGYEGDAARMVYGMPGKWDVTVENRILNEIVKQAEKAGVPKIIR
jgi:neutral ceramidase